MNVHEAGELMDRIVNTWPVGPWPTGTLIEWRKDLVPLEREHAETARVALKKTHAGNTRTAAAPPTWAQFLAAYKAAEPRPDWQPPLDDPPVSAERAREHLAECRAILTKSRPT